jgi:drug/metabolite transporter (DMT)-like permease
MLAVTLALGSSLVYGFSDFLGGVKSRTVPLLSVLLISQGTALLLLAAVVLLSGEGPPDERFIYYGAVAGLSEAVGVAALYRGLAVGVMSIVSAIAATAPVVAVVGAAVAGEPPAAAQGAGISLAVAGVALISYSESGTPAQGSLGSSLLFGLLTAVGFGGFFVAMDAASEGDVPWALLAARVTSVSVFAAVCLMTRPRLGVERGEIPVLASIGALIVGADALYAVATTKGLLSVVAVLSSLYPVVTIALARAYLSERVERLQQIGIAVALCGVAAVSAASG